MSENKRSKLIRFLGYALPILLVVYILSIGPAAILLDYSKYNSGLDYDEVMDDPKYQKYEEWGETFYTPLGWVMESNQSFEYVVAKYLDFCFVIFPNKFKDPISERAERIAENLGIE